ncbi:transmembrane protein 104-like [Asterias rubens]|uniref:transmembrane protein 104-like n=1 Tax=Asterias rubens TaxID=7604 RepID=UPI0014558E74|nr:transmembrane protein 104-like [Asterias rubens]
MPGGGLTETGELYSPLVGLIYVFNLIVGTGALTMPLAFARAGWAMGGALITILAFASFLTATFVVEAMASANAVIRFKRKEKKRELEDSSSDSNEEMNRDYPHEVESEEKQSLLHPPPLHPRDKDKTHPDYFDITERVEMATMASLFFNKVGVNLFYICMAIYLYGDMAIYAVTVPASLRNITCSYVKENASLPLSDEDPCWNGNSLSRINAYRIYLTVFSVVLGSYVFFNVQKTKYLQLLTTFLRWLAFSMMIVLALIVLGGGKGQGRPVAIGAFESIPNFFGVCVYSFMCHHSLPSLITPIKKKTKLSVLLCGDYTIILCFYLLISLTAIFTFKTANIHEIYTLNFFGSTHVTQVIPVQYFIALFPVFTLSTNFPIIAITLRNNVKMLFAREGRPYHWTIDRIIFPLVALLPGVIVAFITTDVTLLVGYTGSYAGAGIQYIIPAFLVYFGRKKTAKLFGQSWSNKHTSPFKHKLWVVFVLLWAVLCIGFVTTNHIISAVQNS